MRFSDVQIVEQQSDILDPSQTISGGSSRLGRVAKSRQIEGDDLVIRSQCSDQLMDFDAARVDDLRLDRASGTLLPKKDEPGEDKVFQRSSDRPAKR
jgi:hypothetical protein